MSSVERSSRPENCKPSAPAAGDPIAPWFAAQWYSRRCRDLAFLYVGAACAHALGRLVATRQLIERDGIELRIVSSGATSTFRTAGTIDGITEIQPGTYLLGDAKYRLAQPEFETALSVLTTVINRPSAGRITVDAGQKKLTSAAQLPQPKDSALRMLKVQEEHGLLEAIDGRLSLRIGDTLELIPWHGGTTVNLYDRMYGIRDGYVAEVWNVAARGS